MKTIKKLSYLLMAGALLFTACNEPEGPDGPNGGKDELVLTADRESIMNDGKAKVTFTVMDGEKDVTTDAVITNTTDNVALDGYTFSSTTGGEYKFTASYDGKTSNEVTINVTSVVLSVDVDEINAEGQGKATFTLMFGEEDVTSEMYLTNVTLGTEMEKGVNEFVSPDYTGEFEFQAKYKNQLSNKVTVTVIPAVESPVRIKADKGRVAIGDVVTFTVLNEGEDVTSSATIKNADSGEAISGNTYTVAAEGTFNFVAEYGENQSQTISVGTGQFHKNVMFLKYTSVGCGYCPGMAESIENADKLVPGRIVEMAVHSLQMGSDPLVPSNLSELTGRFPDTYGLPFTYVDFVGGIQGLVGTAEVVKQVKNYMKNEAYVGFAVDSKIEGNKIIATVNATLGKATGGDFKLGVSLVENGVKTNVSQSGASEGVNYVHNHTYRKSATHALGDALDKSLTENETFTKTYEFDASGYNAENCQVIVYAIKDLGSSMECINVVACDADGWVDYEFE